ncbi:MAG: glutamine-hydrolyzing GMP synthase, partial [Alphaproteobacteria bacterium]|nr:glutamine-hydrolyzing GMP synthase [Alphaproteobacteria bacterium]
MSGPAPDSPLAPTGDVDHERVLILDFGSQVTQLIARRVRESGVYCEILPFNVGEDRIRAFRPSAIILSGGPASVYGEQAPRAPELVFELGLPILGICYGEMLICHQLGGEVVGSDHQEFGRADITVKDGCGLLDGFLAPGAVEPVWMSHGDRIVSAPPGFKVVATSPGAPFAVIANDERKIYGVQFHPEVVHTPRGTELLRNFTHNVAGLKGDWSMAAFKDEAIARIREQVGTGRVICGLSGGVDSSVAAVLLHEAIGDQLTCVFVDHVLLRHGEADEVDRL